MVEKKPQQKDTPIEHISDSESSDEETNPRLHTSDEERIYGTIRGSAIATQVALSDTTAQSNPIVKRGPTRTPKIKLLSKQKAKDQTTQTQSEHKSTLLIKYMYLQSEYSISWI